MDWYRFNTKNDAQACLEHINSNKAFPIVGKNSKTGELQPNKQKTERWGDQVITCQDGKYGFPKVREKMLDNMGIEKEKRNTFLNEYSPSVEEFSADWIPTVQRGT